MRRSLSRLVVALVLLGAAGVAVARSQAPAPAPAPPPLTLEEQRQLARRASERVRALQREADQLLTEERTVLGDLRRLEVARALRAQEIEQLQAEQAVVAGELADTTRHIAALDRTRLEQAPALRARLVELYKLGAGGYARLLLGVDDVRRIARAYRTVSALASSDRERARAHGSTLASLTQARAGLERRQRELASLAERAATARAALDRALADRTALVRSFDDRRDLNARLIGELQAAQQQLERTVRGLPGPDATPAALPLRPFKGALDWPVTGYLTRRFTGTTTNDGAGTGIRLAAPQGTPVRTVHDGVVAYAAPFTGFGRLVIVDHGGQSYSMYGYLDRSDVERGARVMRGQAIGSVGTEPTGRPSLYFSLRIDGQPVDPLEWLKTR